jgi:hypothetical protein
MKSLQKAQATEEAPETLTKIEAMPILSEAKINRGACFFLTINPAPFYKACEHPATSQTWP